MAEQRLPRAPMPAPQARARLVRLLQDAHAGELAAALAYGGHAASLGEPRRSEILRILDEELHHRARLAAMLENLGARPRPAREIRMTIIGRSISAFCRVGGYFIPMYGAGKLERGNIAEYEVAARLAWLAGVREIVEDLLEFAEVEWDHEAYFRRATAEHWLARWVPLWTPTTAREMIRESFRAFAADAAKLSSSGSLPSQIGTQFP